MIDSKHTVAYAYFEPPLGLLYVFSYLKKRGDLDVVFFDLNIEMNFLSKQPLAISLQKIINDFNPDLIAISGLYYSGIHVFHLIAKMIKQLDPNIIVVFGGHYPTILTEDFLADKNMDFAVLSEGELGLSDLIDSLNGKTGLKEVEGISFKDGDNIIRNERENFWRGFSDFERLPWEYTQFKYYFKEGRNVLFRIKDKSEVKLASITATRGCPFQCGFCDSAHFWKKKWRKRKLHHVINEIKHLKENYEVNTIVFNDENISVDKKWFLEFLDEIKKLNITWMSGGGLSIRTINDEKVIRKMCESGIALFNLAIESASNETLKRINKPLTINETLNVIKLIRKYSDIYINGFIISGFHFESLSQVKQTLNFAADLDLDWKNFYCFQPFPGSALYDECKKNNLIGEFDVNYGDIYFAPKLEHIDYTSEELDFLNYLTNLKTNFLQNRNIKLNTRRSLAQSERDFLYVLDMVPDHVFAYLGLAEIMKRRNKYDLRKVNILKVKSIMQKDYDKWNPYLDELDIDLEQLYKEVS